MKKEEIKMLEICLLGTGGMIPLHHRYLTAMLARHNGRMLLIDCGEGTQVSMRELGWGFVHLDILLITHFHADHIAGLPGLLLSLSNYGKTEVLTIVGPKGIQQITESLLVIAPQLLFPIEFIELSSNESTESLHLSGFDIAVLPLMHKMPCFGYQISIPRQGKFDVARAKEQNIPMKYWSRLQNGETIETCDCIMTPQMVLGSKRKGLKVSYITDTRPIDTIPAFVFESDLFICEGLYGDEQFKEKADRFCHMIFSDAAKLAQVGKVKELWLTHYSQAFNNPEDYLFATRKIFENTHAGFDRMTKTLLFEE